MINNGNLKINENIDHNTETFHNTEAFHNTEIQNTETHNVETQNTDVSTLIVNKIIEIKNNIDSIEKNIADKSEELKVINEEKLKLHGAYRHILELALKLGYIKLDN